MSSDRLFPFPLLENSDENDWHRGPPRRKTTKVEFSVIKTSWIAEMSNEGVSRPGRGGGGKGGGGGGGRGGREGVAKEKEKL